MKERPALVPTPPTGWNCWNMFGSAMSLAGFGRWLIRRVQPHQTLSFQVSAL